MSSGINLFVEAAGCPTVCEHCWAQGVGYGTMSLSDVEWVLGQTRQFCQDTGLDMGAFPMHEVAAHPQALEVMRLFLADGLTYFDPLATTGVPIATRDDWRDLINGIAALGTRNFWLAFHGLEAEHDRLVHRQGALRETLLAAERIQSLGLKCGANVFVTKEITAQFDAFADMLEGLGLSGAAWDLARYQPAARARRYEAHRPTADDLLPIAERVRQLTVYGGEQWQNVEDYTEAAWIRKALEGGWESVCEPWELAAQEGVNLVCRPNLDVQTGEAGLYGQRHGNLKRDGVAATLQSAVTYGPRSKDDLYRVPKIAVEDLIARHGDPEGRKVYFQASSLRYRWLDQFAGRA